MPPTRSDKRTAKARTMAAQRAYYEMQMAEANARAEMWHQRAIDLMALLIAVYCWQREGPQGQ